jgi:pimeloyl-ACP methyl ester carboxylesterase
MPRAVHVPGAELAVWERGEGPPVLLVHGIADRGEGWAEAIDDPGLRAIAYDRRGYGGSTAPEPYERTTVEEQAEDAAALLAGLGAGPAVVAGRDLGALVALDLVKRHRALVTGVVAVDPPLYAFSPSATEALSAERVALEESLCDGGPGVAVRDWLAARGVCGPRLDRAAEDHVAFFADFAGLATWPVRRRELRAFDVPLSVLLSDGAPLHVCQAAQALADLVPGATLAAEAHLAAEIARLAA